MEYLNTTAEEIKSLKEQIWWYLAKRENILCNGHTQKAEKAQNQISTAKNLQNLKQNIQVLNKNI